MRLSADYPEETVTFFHTINVAAGTYNETGLHEGYPFARADINVSIIGAGQSTTIFDSAGIYGGIYVNGDIRVILRNLTIQNVSGSAPDSCVNIRGNAEVTIENVTVRRCVASGIHHTSTGLLTLVNVIATENIIDPGGNGVGLSSFGKVAIESGSFSRNEGSGIASRGDLTMTGGIVELNQRNGLDLGGEAALTEVQIRNNGRDLSFRAGIFMGGPGRTSVRNSTLAANQYGAWLRGEGATLYLIDSTVENNPRTGIVVS